jgi:radical SAM protein with 4Fe4S-binding SPASM domain
MIKTYKKKILRSLMRPVNFPKALNILQHYVTYPQSKYFLVGGINIIHRCNLNCAFCVYALGSNKEKGKDMDWATFDRILGLDAFKYTVALSFGSGEAFLHKHLFEFIDKAHKQHRIVTLFTNGTLIQRRLAELVNSPPDLLTISHYDDFEEIQLANLKLIRENKPKSMSLGISKIIGKSNLETMQKIIDVAYDLNLDYIWFQQYSGDHDLSLTQEQIYDTDTEYVNYINQIKSNNKNKLKKIDCTFPVLFKSNKKKYSCMFLFRGHNIDPNGAIQPCCLIDIFGDEKFGNIFNNNDAHITNPALLQLKKSLLNGKNIPEYCKDCPGLYVS